MEIHSSYFEVEFFMKLFLLHKNTRKFVVGLKQIIKQQRILQSGAVDYKLTLPGEPMIYSIKYTLGSRTRSTSFFRDLKWKSLLKSYFRSFIRSSTSVVVIVRFYVSPPDSKKVSARDLKKDTVPALYSYEICEYLLSFLEMLRTVLFNSYRQVVKIDAEKFYSANPRTVFQFMKWDEYVQLQNNNTNNTQSQGVMASQPKGRVQSKRKRNEQSKKLCTESAQLNSQGACPIERSFVSDCALSIAGALESPCLEEVEIPLVTSCEKT